MDGLKAVGPIWLDVTRLVTRAGDGDYSGIDRVEIAYLREALTTDAKFLCRTTRGYLLLGREGGQHLLDLVDGRATLGRADVISWLLRRHNKPRHRVEASLRPLALARCPPTELRRFLATHVTSPITYLNVGHSNMAERNLRQLAENPSVRVAILLHDLIPLTHPEFSQPDFVKTFGDRLKRVRALADVVICNSQDTCLGLDQVWPGDDRRPAIVVSHIGVDARQGRPKTAKRDRNQFMMLGTIARRKNHGMILDVWEMLAKEMPADAMPVLHIIGKPGNRPTEAFARIEQHPLLGTAIRYHGRLSDDEVERYFAQVGALLYPSLAEGFGYPPLEAAMAGALPICSDLPVFRETLGDCGVYVNGHDPYSWLATIKKQIQNNLDMPDLTKLKVPTWQEHFEMVGRALAHHRAEGP